MKKVLIISPHFPPVSAPDIHRVRQSIWFYKKYGWEPIILTVNPKYVEVNKDPDLNKSIPEDVKLYSSRAINQKFTRIFKLGNLDIRAFVHIFFKGLSIIKNEKIDLVFFSTRSFYLMPLGRIWKKILKVPFVIDMHDPWFHKDYLKLAPKDRPPKFWLAYYLNKFSEKYVISRVDGIISVSEGILETLKKRYNRLTLIPTEVITFGAFEKDFEIIEQKQIVFPWKNKDSIICITYIGAYAPYMQTHFELLLKALKLGLKENASLFNKIKLFCIGTSYANSDNARKKIVELASEIGIENQVIEITSRVPYFESLLLMKNSDILFLPGSNDKKYSPSKIYNYILAKRPIISIQNKESDLQEIFNNLGLKTITDDENTDTIISNIKHSIEYALSPNYNYEINILEFDKYSADSLTKKQTILFNQIVK